MKKKLIGFLSIIIGLMIICSWVVGYATLVNAASDWKKCPTKIVFANTKNVKMFYRMLWLDHDCEEWKGKPAERAGGELLPYDSHNPTSEFRLCPGRHLVFWSILGQMNSKKYKVYMFLVSPEMKHVIITPDIVKCKEVSKVPFKILWKQPKNER